MSTNLSKIFVARLIGLDVLDPLGDRLGRLRDVVVLSQTSLFRTRRSRLRSGLSARGAAATIDESQPTS